MAPRFIKDIESIERVQKRATELVHCVKHLLYRERLKVLKILTLSYRRFRGDMIEVYKLLHGKKDIEYTKFFILILIQQEDTHLNLRKSLLRKMSGNTSSLRG